MTNASTGEGREQVDTPTWLSAAGAGDAARVESLLAAGADVNAALESGETALIRAASKGHLNVVRVLLAAGADTNAEREDGFTALGVAVFFGYAEIVRALLAAGADPAAKGRLGTTAEKWALFSGFTEIAEMLSNPDRARDAKAASGAHGYFPNEGTFSTVVPLSKLDESSPHATPEVVESAQPTEGESVVTSQETGEPEVVTLVRPRKYGADSVLVKEADSPFITPTTPATIMTHAVRAERPARSWPVMAIVLALSLVAGATTGAFLLRSTRPAEAQQPLSSSAARPAPAVEVVTQATQPQPAEPTPDIAPSTPAEQLPATGSTTEAESQAALNDAAEAESRTRKSVSDSTARKTEENKPVTPNASRAATSGDERARGAEVSARRGATTDERARSRPAPAVVEKTGDTRRAATTPRRPLNTERRASTVPPRDNSSPVISPPPSATSEKSKVIPWP